ncbi:hypothetical protein ILP92_01835 [Maribius pontilimi]|uniref:Uncharacterized protein n=1 Tax=Palleronia pontilimi TaxID=1964209 RepID=A0A934M8K0_9RHOB|nr:hypothetical protein [Palleronia pontilimi]MBJ3761492.1 hypothetical protein [Palleronia pontilimi]
MIWALAYMPVLAGLATWTLGGSRRRLGALGAASTLAPLALAVLSADGTGRFGWSKTIVL